MISNENILSLLIFLPMGCAVLLGFFGKDKKEEVKWCAFIFSLIIFIISIPLWLRFDSNAGMQFVQNVPWISKFNIRYHIGIDGISLFLILLTTFLTPLTILCSWKQITNHIREFFIAILFLEGSMIGVFAAADMFLFYIFWEAMLLPMYLLIGVWGGESRIHAAVKFFIYTMVGSLFMFLAIIYLYLKAGNSFNLETIASTSVLLPLSIQTLLFFAFALSFAIKVPIFPFHTWLPWAHTEAPTAGSVILAGILLKMGAYGFLRFAIPFFPYVAKTYAPLFCILAIIGIIYGALMALAQSDIKKLIAYSSVSHLGFVILGIFTFTAYGVSGGIYQMLNHGISTGALFILVGLIYERTHTRRIDNYGGIAAKVPAYATVFMIVLLSSIGLPGTNGFIGEFLILLGTFQYNPWFAVFGATGVILGAYYMLSLYRRVMFGPYKYSGHGKLTDLNFREYLYTIPLIIFIFVMGIFPNLFLKKIAPTVDKYLNATNKAVEVSIENLGGDKDRVCNFFNLEDKK